VAHKAETLPPRKRVGIVVAGST